jgi:hypothetical protein
MIRTTIRSDNTVVPGDRGAVPSGFAYHRGGLAGDGGLVDGSDLLDDLAVGRGDVARFADDQVTFGQCRWGHLFFALGGVEAAGLGIRPHAPQRLGLGLATGFGAMATKPSPTREKRSSPSPPRTRAALTASS